MGYLNEDGLATLVGKVKGQVVQLTQAEYMQIPDSEKNFNNKIYFVEDEEFSWKIDDEPTLNSDGLAKSGGIYTYTSKIGSGTLTTTAKTIIPAINELDSKLDSLKTLTTGTLTANSGVTLDSNYTTVYKIGRVCMMACIVTLTENKSSYSRLVEIPEGFRPYRQFFRDCGTYQYDVVGSGAIRNVGAMTSGSRLLVSEMFIIGN